MKVIGLTGGIGSGKSTVARLFQQQGVHTVDADDVAREVVEPGTPALASISEHFGPQVLNEHGALDRATLRRIVFETPFERTWLEQLLHPLIRDELMRQLWTTPSTPVPDDYAPHYVMLISPLLLETDQHQLVDQVIVVDVPVEIQIERTVARDDNDRDQVERIIAAQMSREERCRRGDIIINNNRSLDAVTSDVKRIDAELNQP